MKIMQASKDSKVQRRGKNVRFTVVIPATAYEILADAHQVLNFRQLSQRAVIALAEELRESKNAEMPLSA